MATTLRNRPDPTTVRPRRLVESHPGDPGRETCEDHVPDPVLGYGACSISGCPCKAYQQTYGTDLCNNCGHKYTDHW